MYRHDISSVRFCTKSNGPSQDEEYCETEKETDKAFLVMYSTLYIDRVRKFSFQMIVF